MKRQTSNVSFLLGAAVSIVVVLIAAVLLVVSSLLSGAITASVEPFLGMASQVAANAAAPALQLDSASEVSAALQPYADNPLFTFVRAKNKSGVVVFAHRKKGLPAISEVASEGESDGELFHSIPITSDAGQLGTLTIGMSLAERDAAASSARKTLAGIGLVAVVGMIVSMRSLLRWKLERPLQATTSEILESAGQVLQLSRMVATSSQSLSQGATEQAASLEETSASMEEMSSMTRRNAENATQATRLVTEVAGQVTASNEALAEMVTSMEAIKESSNKVAKIIKTIDEIAFQTNILALNAAVEAARAGEAGMGFAVVADEVRNLAQRSAQAARDTAALIEESITRSQEGAGKVGQVASAIDAITRSVSQVKGMVEEVREASLQQTQGIDQVSQTIAQMEKVTQTTAATAEESAAASEELNAQAESSIAVVSKLDGWRVGATRDLLQRPGSNGSKPSAPGQSAFKPAHATRKMAAKLAAARTALPRAEEQFPLSDGQAPAGF